MYSLLIERVQKGKNKLADVVDAEGPVVKFRDLHYLHFPIYTVAPLKLF